MWVKGHSHELRTKNRYFSDRREATEVNMTGSVLKNAVPVHQGNDI